VIFILFPGDNQPLMVLIFKSTMKMANYTESTDKKFTGDIIDAAPQQARAWLAFDHIVTEVTSAIPSKYKELIAIAVALTTQCPYCIERHTKKAKELGCTQEEIAETIMTAVGRDLLQPYSYLRIWGSCFTAERIDPGLNGFMC
jgi:AhpD family alkylhydroperoxidase